MFIRTSITVLVFFALASAASACGLDVRGDYNYVNQNCTVVQRDANAALIDGLFGVLAAQYSPQPQLAWVEGYCQTYGGYVPCGQWVWR